MVIRDLTIALLFVALAFMNIGGCGGSSSGSDCANIAGIILLLFTETSNDCGEPLSPPELVMTDCSQSGCSLNCTFTDEEGDSIDTSGSISKDGIVNLFGTASFEDPGPPPIREDVELSCLVEVTDDGDLIDGTCTQSSVVVEFVHLIGVPTFSCVFEFDIEEALTIFSSNSDS